MSFESQFLQFMPFTVTLEAPTGRNAQGLPTYAGATVLSFRARIIGPIQDLRKPGSSERAETYTLWVNSGTESLTSEYRLTLPAAAPWNSRQPMIWAVSPATDDRGVHHSKITCGFMYHRQGQT